MAATNQTSAEKKRKQLIILAVLGLVLVVIAVLQGPKLLGGGEPEAAPTPSSTAGGAPALSPGATSTPVGFSGTATLAGVRIVPGVAPKPTKGQLASFSLFDRHDPFVQLVKDPLSGDTGGGETAPAPGVKVSGGGAPAGSQGTPGVTGSTTGEVANPSGLTSATIWVNGTDEAVDVKKRFPKTDPTFVLLSLKPKSAQIGVVGGAFTGGETIALKMGQTLTLVNTATGARYTLRLLYTGTEPEQVQQFNQGN